MTLIERLNRLSTCQVSDGMAAVGLPREGLSGIEPLEPAQHIAGCARTVVFEPAPDAEDRRIEYLSHVEPGDVLVLGNGGRVDCSVWGGQRSTGAIQRGAVGTIVDGAYRDVDEHRSLGYPVFGRARTIVSSSGSVVPVAVDRPLVIGGVEVHSGDYVVADASGVVVVPADRAEDVVAAAESILEEESRISAAVETGTDFVDFRAEVRGARA